MIQALHKTGHRTGRFLGNALTWRLPDREYAPVAWGLVAGGIWLSVSLVDSPDRAVPILVSSYLVALLAVISAIDARYGVIPDGLVVAVALGGTIQMALSGRAGLLERGGESLEVFLAAALFRAGYRFLRGQEGLGLGDVKFVAAGAVWIGIEGIPVLMLLGVLSAFASLAILRAGGLELSRKQPISFGPHLAVALWLAWVAGPVSF